MSKISDILPPTRDQIKLSYHKHKDSVASDTLSYVLEFESSALVSPTSVNHSSNSLTHKNQKAESGAPTPTLGNGRYKEEGSLRLEGQFSFKAATVSAKLTPSSLSWKHAPASCCSKVLSMGVCGRQTTATFPIESILSAKLLHPGVHSNGGSSILNGASSASSSTNSSSGGGSWCLPCIEQQGQHKLQLYAYAPHRKNPSQWQLVQHTLSTCSLEQAQMWAHTINSYASGSSERPKNLLVFVNPFSGKKSGQRVWERSAQPVFDRSRIKYTVVNTERMDHAFEVVAGMRPEELLQYSGIVAVGGDGLFQEVMRGLLAHRAAAGLPGTTAAALQRMRLGHIPAGSTDAVAYTINGCRCPTTAALHIAIGDRSQLDVARAEGESGTQRFFCCMASYGFMGDVMKMSEGYRWMGPARYDFAGACCFAGLASYRMSISYKPAPQDPHHVHPQVCSHKCTVCSSAQLHSYTAVSPKPTTSSPAITITAAEGPTTTAADPTTPPAAPAAASSHPASPPAAVPAAAGGAPKPGHSRQPSFARPMEGHPPDFDVWKQLDGEYVSIMCVVTPCRSDKSSRGVMPHAHIADGVLNLVLVHSCSRPQYLQFLVALTTKGITPGEFDFVEVHSAKAVMLRQEGSRSSSWNIDGELMEDSAVGLRVHRGLVEVFARGPAH